MDLGITTEQRNQAWAHWSSESKLIVVSQAQPQRTDKPVGVYCAVGNAWADWTSENGIGTGEHRYEVKLSPTARVLRIDPSTWPQVYRLFGCGGNLIPRIDWRAVSEKFDGVYVAVDRSENQTKTPLFWFQRMFDVETLCIWNKNSLELQ